MMTPIDRQILGALICPFGGQVGADCKRPLVVILFTFKAGELSGCSPLLGAWHSKHTTAGLIPRERSDPFLKGSEKASGC